MTNGRARSGILAGSAAVVLLFGAGCDGLLEPARVEATAWALESLDGAPIPAVSVANDWVTLLTRADTLRFSDGRGVNIVYWDAAYTSAEVADESGRTESAFSYRLREGRVEISVACPPNALCVAPPHMYAVPVDALLRVELAGGGGPVRIYRRVGQP
jgi:hypothetical protein